MSKYYITEEDVGNLGIPLFAPSPPFYDSKEEAEKECDRVNAISNVVVSVWKVDEWKHLL